MRSLETFIFYSRHASSRSRPTLVTLFLFGKNIGIVSSRKYDQYITLIMTRHAFITLSSRYEKSQNAIFVLAMHKEIKFKHRHTQKKHRHALVTFSSRSRHIVFLGIRLLK